MAKTNDNCGSCRFYFPLEFIGHCKRYPKFEQKSQYEWCGEHYSKLDRIPSEVLDAIMDSPMAALDDLTPKKRGRPAKGVA